MNTVQSTHSLMAHSYIGRSGVGKRNSLNLSVLEFTDTPGVGYRDLGPFSGEQFLEEYLLPKYKQAVEERKQLVVSMDGTGGYGPSFIEVAFKGLVEKTKDRKIKERLIVTFDDDPQMRRKLWKFLDAELANLR